MNKILNRLKSVRQGYGLKIEQVCRDTCYGRYPKQFDGRIKYYKQRGFKTRKEAKLAEVKLLEEHKGFNSLHITLNDLIKAYRKDAPNQLKESTIQGYTRIENNITIPTFGNKYIEQITPFEIQRWINDIYNKKMYCDETIKGILLHLSGLLTYGVKHDWLIRNPVSLCTLPRNPNKKTTEKSSKDNYWEFDEYEDFIETVEDGHRYDIYEFCFYTGLRIGEFTSLQWKHVDLKLGTITVEQSLSAITSKITSPKTGNSYRTIKVPSKIIEKLKIKYDYVSQIRDFNEDWFIYSDKHYISISTVRRWFNEDIRKASVKIITFHGLRHSHASYLLSNPQLSEQLIADRMGHTVKTLRETYSHVYKKHRKLLDEYIDNL